MTTPHTDWEKRFDELFGTGGEQVKWMNIHNIVIVEQVKQFIRKAISHAVAETEKKCKEQNFDHYIAEKHDKLVKIAVDKAVAERTEEVRKEVQSDIQGHKKACNDCSLGMICEFLEGMDFVLSSLTQETGKRKYCIDSDLCRRTLDDTPFCIDCNLPVRLPPETGKVSLCENGCYCMTKTVHGKCGKCGASKSPDLSEGDGKGGK